MFYMFTTKCQVMLTVGFMVIYCIVLYCIVVYKENGAH